MRHTLFRNIISTVLYIIVLFFVLWGNNLLINWALFQFIIPFFGWFYNLSFILKIIFIVFAGSITAAIIFGFLIWLVKLIGKALSYIFLYNKPTFYISILMVSVNIICSIIDMWAFIKFDFWSLIIWILILNFVFLMNWAFVFRNREVLEREALLKSLQS